MLKHFIQDNYLLRQKLDSIVNTSSNKIPHEEHISSFSKTPNLKLFVPPLLVRQPATVGNVYIICQTSEDKRQVREYWEEVRRKTAEIRDSYDRANENKFHNIFEEKYLQAKP